VFHRAAYHHHTNIHVQAELLSYYVDHCFKPVAITTANYIVLSAVLIQNELEMCASFSVTQQKKATQKDIYFLLRYLNLAVYKVLTIMVVSENCFG